MFLGSSVCLFVIYYVFVCVCAHDNVKGKDILVAGRVWKKWLDFAKKKSRSCSGFLKKKFKGPIFHVFSITLVF